MSFWTKLTETESRRRLIGILQQGRGVVPVGQSLFFTPGIVSASFRVLPLMQEVSVRLNWGALIFTIAQTIK